MKVFCCSYQDYALDALGILARSHGWEPVYFQTSKSIDGRVKAVFPLAVRHSYLDAVKGRPAPSFPREAVEANQDVLQSLEAAGELATAIKMFDRNQSRDVPMDYSERLSLIEWFSGYWTSVLSTLEVDLVIFEEVPHQVTDFILYACAKQLGIRRLVPIRTLPRSGYLISDSYDRFSLQPRSDKFTAPPRYQLLADYATLMRGNYANYAKTMFFDAPDTMKLFSTHEEVTDKQSRVSAAWNRIVRIVDAAKLLFSFENDRKAAGKRLSESRVGYWAYRQDMKRTIATKRELRRIYEGGASAKPSSSAPYVFCALQYQPEASTCPKGGEFVEQLLMVQVLLSVLPEGWRLAVKEHPNQFSSKYARFAETARSPAFYEELTRDPRVELISLGTPSFEMVDGSSAVASVGGTICLEAVVRGKPSLNFGTGFFDKVQGIFKIDGVTSARPAMEMIAGGFVPDAEKVVANLRTIDDACYSGAIGGPVTLDEIGLSQTANANIHAESWLDWLSRNPVPTRLSR